MLRKLIAYSLIVVLVGGLALWSWNKARRQRIERERRHGPRPD